MKDSPQTNPPSQPRHIGHPAKPLPKKVIPDSPENVALTIMKTPPKKNWRYLKNGKSK